MPVAWLCFLANDGTRDQVEVTLKMEDVASGGIRILIVGAGLAGLAAALSTKLANPAHEVVVFEGARELQEIGVSPVSLRPPTSLPAAHVLSVRPSVLASLPPGLD